MPEPSVATVNNYVAMHAACIVIIGLTSEPGLADSDPPRLEGGTDPGQMLENSTIQLASVRSIAMDGAGGGSVTSASPLADKALRAALVKAENVRRETVLSPFVASQFTA